MIILWKLYFYWLALVTIVSIPGYLIASIVSEQYQFSGEIFIESLCVSFSIFGLYGFVYKKPVLWLDFWRVYTVAFLSWEAWSYFQVTEYSLFDVVSIILSWFPLYYALVMYGFNRKNLWVVAEST